MMSETPLLGILLDAVIFAAHKHQGQVRKDQSRSPYVTHPLAVARAIWEIGQVKDQTLLIAAVLHDTIEDTETSKDEIRKRFGEEVLSIVIEVTDEKSQEKMIRKQQQVTHAATLSHSAKILKLADKLCNCQDILYSPPDNWTMKRRQDYIQWAADVIAQMRDTNPGLETALDQVFSDAEEQLEIKIQPFETVNQRPWGPNSIVSSHQE